MRGSHRPLCDVLVAERTAALRPARRAAKDNVSVLLKGGWIEKRTHSSEQRRASYRLTEKAHADMGGTFGRTALKRGRRLYSTCLSGRARSHQAARRKAARTRSPQHSRRKPVRCSAEASRPETAALSPPAAS